jgi:hypothetical protein
MELTFRVQLAEMTLTPPTGKNTSSTKAWTMTNKVYPCDIAPLKDDIYFLQTGVENLITHVIHFYANTDINVRDVVKVLSSFRLAGPVGSWFEIRERLEPTETIAFVRCYAMIVDPPRPLTVVTP